MCSTSARGRCCTRCGAWTPTRPAAASRWGSGSATWPPFAGTRAACACRYARSNTRSSFATGSASGGVSTIRHGSGADGPHPAEAAPEGVRLDRAHWPRGRAERLLPRGHGRQAAMDDQPRVHPGPDALPALAGPQLLHPRGGHRRSARRLAWRRRGRDRPHRAGRAHPARGVGLLFPHRHRPKRRLGHARRGRRRGRTGLRHDGAHHAYHHPPWPRGPRGRRDLRPRRAAPRPHGGGGPAGDAGVALDIPTAAWLGLVMLDLVRMTWTFLWLSLICVGGGLGVIPELQRQVVDRHHWVTAREFLDGYTLSQLTPGPNMMVAVFVGYRAHGLVGALLACTAMFLPVSILTATVARHWETLRDRPWARACEHALAPIGIGLMGAGVYTLARSGVQDWTTGALALLAAVVLYGRWLPPLALVILAGAVGYL